MRGREPVGTPGSRAEENSGDGISGRPGEGEGNPGRRGVGDLGRRSACLTALTAAFTQNLHLETSAQVGERQRQAPAQSSRLRGLRLSVRGGGAEANQSLRLRRVRPRLRASGGGLRVASLSSDATHWLRGGA